MYRTVMQFSSVPPFRMFKIRREHSECHAARPRNRETIRPLVRERVNVETK
jgi:hypothetical protein